MADNNFACEFTPVETKITEGEDWIKMFSSNCPGHEQAAAAANLPLREQIVGTPKGKMAPGRQGGQVTEGLDGGVPGFVYLYPGDKNPQILSMEGLEEPLRALVQALSVLFRLETGYSANNVLIQLYNAMTGIGEHPDDTRGLNKVGGDGSILSYNGVHTRLFRIRNNDGKKIGVVLEPGTAVLFKDGQRRHELVKPYTCTKPELAACQRAEQACVVPGRLFRCDCAECAGGHPCRCPLRRLNVTLRHLVEVEKPAPTPRKRCRSNSTPSTPIKKAK